MENEMTKNKRGGEGKPKQCGLDTKQLQIISNSFDLSSQSAH